MVLTGVVGFLARVLGKEVGEFVNVSIDYDPKLTQIKQVCRRGQVLAGDGGDDIREGETPGTLVGCKDQGLCLRGGGDHAPVVGLSYQDVLSEYTGGAGSS
ncbi:hypothetical protein CDL15_Pgr013085 [Punica granatum]|nr:hypothetical protein CDL15_Pgr013085 [Punica granatum]